jgi:hypothetical protein
MWGMSEACHGCPEPGLVAKDELQRARSTQDQRYLDQLVRAHFQGRVIYRSPGYSKVLHLRFGNSFYRGGWMKHAFGIEPGICMLKGEWYLVDGRHVRGVAYATVKDSMLNLALTAQHDNMFAEGLLIRVPFERAELNKVTPLLRKIFAGEEFKKNVRTIGTLEFYKPAIFKDVQKVKLKRVM